MPHRGGTAQRQVIQRHTSTMQLYPFLRKHLVVMAIYIQRKGLKQ